MQQHYQFIFVIYFIFWNYSIKICLINLEFLKVSILNLFQLYSCPICVYMLIWIVLHNNFFIWLKRRFMLKLNLRLQTLHHSHKKWKDSLETLAVSLIFLLELEISGVALQRIYQNSIKLWLLCGIAQWKWVWGCFSHFLLLWLWC